MHTNPVTVLIPTFNNIEQLPLLLTDVNWADQVLIVDSFSSDGTVEFALQYGADVIQHEYINSAKQKNWAIPQCKGPWVLIIDTDERIPSALQHEIRELLNSTEIPSCVDAYRVARRTYFLGEWLTVMNLWPDYQVRLFRRDVGRYEDKEVHADVVVPGYIRTLNNPLDHFATPALSKQIGLLDRYSTYQADELEKRGIVFKWHNLLLRPVVAFLYYLAIKQGYRAGFRGLFIAYHTMTFVFFTHAKLWEKSWKKKQRSDELR